MLDVHLQKNQNQFSGMQDCTSDPLKQRIPIATIFPSQISLVPNSYLKSIIIKYVQASRAFLLSNSVLSLLLVQHQQN